MVGRKLAVALEIIVGIRTFCREKFFTDSIHEEYILLNLMHIATRHKPEISFTMVARHGANSFTQRRPRFRST